MAEAVHVPALLTLPGSPQAKQLHHPHTQPSLGQSCHKLKSLASLRTGSLQWCPTLCDPVDRGLPSISVREGFSRQEYWRVLANTGNHHKSTVVPAALAANPPEYLVLPEPLRLKQLHHLHIWPSLGQTQVFQGSLRSKPHWTTHLVEIKPQLKPRGSVAKEEDPKPSHQLYKLQKKSTYSIDTESA